MLNLEKPVDQIKEFLTSFQFQLCDALEVQEEGGKFKEESWKNVLGEGCTCVLEAGKHLERAGVNVSHILGERLPAAATTKHPDLTGCRFEALGLSSVIHPRNPYVPTTHLNVRFFVAYQEEKVVGWFGGGFDLTPYYGFEEDCKLWHQHALKACETLGEGYYKKFKSACDDYFFLKARNEPRGIGGIFYDDLSEPEFPRCFEFMKNVASHFLVAYITILKKRKNYPYGEKERDFQLYRRGRYVEFNLLYDRGTLFGLQSQGRIESILISMPPEVSWRYQWEPQPNSLEAKLYQDFLIKREWV